MRQLIIALFAVHVALLLLASTNFSAVSWVWGDPSFSWNYFQYSHRSGWGRAYVSEYELNQIVCYIAAYGLGVAAFAVAWFRYQPRLSVAATVLCVVGTASFCIEATHWMWDHHFSWIASFPGVMAILWIVVGVQLARSRRGGAMDSEQMDQTPAP